MKGVYFDLVQVHCNNYSKTTLHDALIDLQSYTDGGSNVDNEG